MALQCFIQSTAAFAMVSSSMIMLRTNVIQAGLRAICMTGARLKNGRE